MPELLETNLPGLTTNRAPFVEQAQRQGELYIHQPYSLYSEGNHEAWRRLYARIQPKWQQYANDAFLKGVSNLCLPADRVPNLTEVNQFLCPLTGFQAKAVSGYIPAFLFFNSLRNREFPTTITIRSQDQLNYLPEPDIFHDIAGHVPMHTDPQFADTLVRFGECAHTAAQQTGRIRDKQERIEVLRSRMKAMARFFWFTIEFGLMRSAKGLKAYGSGLLSSFGELPHSIESPEVQRYPLQLEWAVNQAFEIDHYQPLLFVVDSFDHLFSYVDQLEQWMRMGKLDHVAPGQPELGDEDLKSFLNAELG